MPTAADLDMIALEDLGNPVTFRYNLTTSWGITSQEITLDIPQLDNLIPESFAYAARLWTGAIATAISHNCELSFTEMVRWKSFAFPLVGASGRPQGQRPGAGTERKLSGVISMHSGFTGKYAKRPLYLPNLPIAWQDGGVLSETGRNGLYGLAATLFMGLNEILYTSPTAWLLAFPRLVTATPSNVSGVAFRRVQWIRIHSYCDKAPDTVPIDWP